MKLKYDARNGDLRVVLDDSDFSNVAALEEMISGKCLCRKCGSISETQGWKIFERYLKSARELLIEKGKDGTHNRVQRGVSDLKFAKIDGFDYAVGLAQRLVDQARALRPSLDKVKEVEGDGQDY